MFQLKLNSKKHISVHNLRFKKPKMKHSKHLFRKSARLHDFFFNYQCFRKYDRCLGRVARNLAFISTSTSGCYFSIPVSPNPVFCRRQYCQYPGIGSGKARATSLTDQLTAALVLAFRDRWAWWAWIFRRSWMSCSEAIASSRPRWRCARSGPNCKNWRRAWSHARARSQRYAAGNLPL